MILQKNGAKTLMPWAEWSLPWEMVYYWLPEPTCSCFFKPSCTRVAPRRWNWTTVPLDTYGFESCNLGHWVSSGRHPNLVFLFELKFFLDHSILGRWAETHQVSLIKLTPDTYPAYNRNAPIMIRAHRCYHCPHTDSEVCVRTMFPGGRSQTSRKLNRKFTRIPIGFIDIFFKVTGGWKLSLQKRQGAHI